MIRAILQVLAAAARLVLAVLAWLVLVPSAAMIVLGTRKRTP